jgi:hypothetical protein
MRSYPSDPAAGIFDYNVVKSSSLGNECSIQVLATGLVTYPRHARKIQ